MQTPWPRDKEGNFFDLLKEYCAPDTQTHLAVIDNRFCQVIEKFFVQAKSTSTLCIWTMHVSHENNSAIVLPSIRGDCTTHCDCSQLFHTFLQFIIGSFGDGEFHDG